MTPEDLQKLRSLGTARRKSKVKPAHYAEEHT